VAAAVIAAAPDAANLSAAAAPRASDGNHQHDRQRLHDSHAPPYSNPETKITYIHPREITSTPGSIIPSTHLHGRAIRPQSFPASNVFQFA
jgi:hypothetical protein